MKDIIADLPKGPLDSYRKCATFNWKLLKLNLEGEDFVKFQVFGKKFYSSNIFNTFSSLSFQNTLWDFIKKSPAFQRHTCATLDEERRLCNARVRALRDNNIAVYIINNNK